MKKLILSALSLFICPYFAFAQTDSAYVTVNMSSEIGFLVRNLNYNQCIPINDGERVSVRAGKSTLKLVSKDFQDIDIRVDLDVNEEKLLNFKPKFIKKPSDKKKLSTYARCYWDANVIILTDDNSKVSFNNQDYESGLRLEVVSGTQVIASISNGDFNSNVHFKATDELQIISNYYRPSKSLVLKRSLLPGYAQITKRQNLKGALFGTVSTGLGAAFIYYNLQISNGTNEYNDIEERYSAASNPEEILLLVEQADMKMEEIESYERKRNLSLLSLAAVYGLNILDALKAPKFGFRNTSLDIDPYVDFDRNLIPRATLKVDIK